MAVRRILDPDAWATKQNNRAQAASSDWLDGVQNPSTSPVDAMRKAKGRYKAEVTKSLAEGRWDKAIDRLTDEFIASQATKAGAGAYSTGVSNGADVARAAIARLQPKVAALKTKLDAMPSETDAQREAKMLEAMRGMKAIGAELAASR